MKEVLKKIGILIVSILLQILLCPVQLIVLILSIIETMSRVLKSTTTFLVKEIKREVLN